MISKFARSGEKVTITAKVQDKEKTCNINVSSKTSISKIEDKDGNLLDASLYDISAGTTILSRVLIKGQWLDFESKVTGDGELSIESDEQIFNNPLEILVIR